MPMMLPWPPDSYFYVISLSSSSVMPYQLLSLFLLLILLELYLKMADTQPKIHLSLMAPKGSLRSPESIKSRDIPTHVTLISNCSLQYSTTTIAYFRYAERLTHHSVQSKLLSISM